MPDFGNIATNALGGGIYTDNNFGGEISACTITDNEVQGDPGFQRGAGIIVVNTNNIFNCLVWSNRWSGTLPEQERDLGMYAWIDDLAAQSNSRITAAVRAISAAPGATSRIRRRLSGLPVKTGA